MLKSSFHSGALDELAERGSW